MTDCLLECNQNNANTVVMNGKYTCTFPQGIPIYEGDQITARLTSVDSAKTDSNTIVVPDDITPTIVFSYYDCDYPDVGAVKTQFDGNPWLPGGQTNSYQYYAGYADIVSTRLDLAYMLIPIGQVHNKPFTFTNRLWFSWIDPEGISHSDNLQGGGSYGSVVIEPFPPTIDHSLLSPLGDPIYYRSGTLKCIKVSCKINDGTEYGKLALYNGLLNQVTVLASNPGLIVNHVSFNLKAGKYDPLEISTLLTLNFSNPNGISGLVIPPSYDQMFIPNNPLLYQLDTPEGQTMIWVPIVNGLQPPIDNTCYKYVPGTGRFVGAALMAIQYGQTGDIFQWSFGYTPFSNVAVAGGVGGRNVAIYTTNVAGHDTRYYLLTTATGISIHDLQPKKFWQDIGLYDAMITKLSPFTGGSDYFTYHDWIHPEEGTSLSFFTPSYIRNEEEPMHNPAYFATDAIPNKSILGTALNSNPTGGYFLIRGSFNSGTTNYYDNESIRTDIVAVVSTQYNSANTITGFGDSAIAYTHKGAPFTISHIDIDILDPLTKMTAPALGANNTVIFQIQRAPRQINVVDVSGKIVPAYDTFSL